MGRFVNSGNSAFQVALNSEIYVDKTGLLAYTNKVMDTTAKFICNSRPRRFGKSITADMLTAYYCKGCSSEEMFSSLEIGQAPGFTKYLNQYDVIRINMQEFLSQTKNIYELLDRMKRLVLRDLKREYPNVDYFDDTDLIESMQDVYQETNCPFVVIIDEWDCVFREYQQDKKAQEEYLDFLRDFLKDKVYVALAYLTGILPIKKYGTQSALTDFTEFTMLEPGPLAPYVGFTEDEVKKLCTGHHMDYEEMRRWYDGYYFDEIGHVYNPNSVIKAVFCGKYSNYWTQTETYESLRIYIDLNFDGLKECLVDMLGGKRCRVDIGSFQNDMTSMKSRDDVLTLLVHLGYLGYDADNKEVYIPNEEIREEFIRAIKNGRRQELVKAIQLSDHLLKATINLHY